MEAGADLPGEDKIFVFKIADEERAQPNASAWGVGDPGDHQLLRFLALHLQPVRGAAMLVSRVAALRDYAFPALAARALPRLWIAERGHALQGRLKGQAVEQCATFLERQQHHVAAF